MMPNRIRSLLGLAAGALLATAVSTSAAPVIQIHSAGSNTQAGAGAPSAGYGAYLPTGATGWDANPTYTPPPPSHDSITLSPFNGDDTPYFLVTTATGTVPGQGGQQSPVVLSFGPAQSSLNNFLWGSIDSTNRMDFKLNGTTVWTVLGSDLLGTSPIGTSEGDQYAFVSFLLDAGDTFNSIEFSTGTVAFEFATPIPLPAAAWLMIAGIGGLGLMARRRKATDA